VEVADIVDTVDPEETEANRPLMKKLVEYCIFVGSESRYNLKPK
jgi:hypothetical protein